MPLPYVNVQAHDMRLFFVYEKTISRFEMVRG